LPTNPFLPLRCVPMPYTAVRCAALRCQPLPCAPAVPIHANAVRCLPTLSRALLPFRDFALPSGPSRPYAMPSIPAAAILCGASRCNASRADPAAALQCDSSPYAPTPSIAWLYDAFHSCHCVARRRHALRSHPMRGITCPSAPAAAVRCLPLHRRPVLSIPVPHRPFLCAALRDRTSIPANALLSRASHSCAMLCTPQKGYSAASRTCTTFGHSWCSNSRPSAKSSTSSAVASRNVP